MNRRSFASLPRLLVIGPLTPPPLGGVQHIMEMQLRSGLAREFEPHVVDTSKGQLRLAAENPTWKMPLYFVRDFSRLIRTLVRVRPDAALIHASPSLSFLRDWVFMVTARLAGAKVICHYQRYPAHTLPFVRNAHRPCHRPTLDVSGSTCDRARPHLSA